MTTVRLYLKDFFRYRYLLYNLISRDFKLKYRRSVLGVAWSVLNPLLMCAVMVVVFGGLFGGRGSGIDNFPVYLVIGQLMFTFFRESTTMAMGSVMANAMLLRKVYIPKYIFPLEKTCFGLVNYFFSFIALIIIMIVTGTPLHATVLLAVYPIVTLFFFSLGVGLVLSTMAVFFRDVIHLWEVFTTVLMYFSAIFYHPSQFGVAALETFIKFNPIYWYITAFRAVVLDGELLTWNMVWICGLCSLVMLALGLFVFKKKQDKFVLYM